MRFRFDALSTAFSNGCAFDENAQHVSVDERPNLVEMYTGPRLKISNIFGGIGWTGRAAASAAV